MESLNEVGMYLTLLKGAFRQLSEALEAISEYSDKLHKATEKARSELER